MDIRLLVVKVISLLHCESTLGTFGADSVELARQVLSRTEIPNHGADNDLSRETIEGLLSTANWAATQVANRSPLVKEELLQRIMMNVRGEEYIYNSYLEFTKSLKDENKLKRIKFQTAEEINHYYNAIEIEKILKKGRNELIFNRSTINWSEFVADIIMQLEPYQRAGGGDALEALGVISRINVGETDKVNDYFRPKENGQASALADHIFRWGWQGVNNFFGEGGGLRRVDFGMVSALAHNFKSGFLLNSFRQFARYNRPYPCRKEGLKPMGLFISYEMSTDDIYRDLYSQIMLNEHGIKINPKLISQDIVTISEVVKNYMEVNGWNIEIVHIDPDNSNFRKLFALVEYYEAMGYEIQFCVCDYLSKLNKEGCTQGTTGTDIKNLVSRVKNFFNGVKGIAFLTAHQMSSKAVELERAGVRENLVKEVMGKGYYENCSTLQTEPDTEIYLYKCETDDGTYLTMARGKYRTNVIVPARDLYCAYRFNDDGIPGFADDLLGNSRALSKVGADSGIAYSDEL